jgi:hypothetical protein
VSVNDCRYCRLLIFCILLMVSDSRAGTKNALPTDTTNVFCSTEGGFKAACGSSKVLFLASFVQRYFLRSSLWCCFFLRLSLRWWYVRRIPLARLVKQCKASLWQVGFVPSLVCGKSFGPPGWCVATWVRAKLAWFCFCFAVTP